MKNIREFISGLVKKETPKQDGYLNEEQSGRVYLSDLEEDEILFLKTLLKCENLKDISKEEGSHLEGMGIEINDFYYYSKDLIIYTDDPETIYEVLDSYDKTLTLHNLNSDLDLHINYIKLVSFNDKQALKVKFIQENFLDKIENNELKELANKNLRFIENSNLFEKYNLDNEKPNQLVEGDYILKEGNSYEVLKYKGIEELKDICESNSKDEIYVSAITRYMFEDLRAFKIN